MPLLDKWYADHLSSVVSDDVTIDIHTLPAEAYPKSIPEGVVRFGAVETFFSTYFAQQALEADRQGYDAFVIGTSQDPGLREARTLARIPVLGYGETAFHISAMSGNRFGVVGFIRELAEPIRENVAAAGLLHRLSGFHYLQGGQSSVVAALEGDPERFLQDFRASAREAIAAGAQVLIPGEGLPNEILWSLGVHDIDGVPIIDADGLVVSTAEFMVRLTRHNIMRRSQVGYWMAQPDGDYVDHLRSVFWSRPSPPREES
ncbi:aspartate/glutamate racemase family protein [Streptomyces canus]|uniref:aspartate/glutamate racemase family protein n=1 Tax=Streptomyces canus TaxID=58343 RepID=UPI00036AF3C4|nr:aspartate/glutamate racemase family protein [Streptomyces canus]